MTSSEAFQSSYAGGSKFRLELTNRKKRFLVAYACVAVLVLASGAFYMHQKAHHLWNVIHQECLPNQAKNGNPSPCLKVDEGGRYVLFKSERAALHYRLAPTESMDGIESELLQTEGAPPLFAYAWSNHGQLFVHDGTPIKDDLISMAVDSVYSRSQDQLQIHMACLRPDIYADLSKQYDSLRGTWAKLRLGGRRYVVRKLDDLNKQNPFKLLGSYAGEFKDDIGRYGLVVAHMPSGSFALIMTRMNLWRFSLGSGEALQDDSCRLAGN